MTDITNQTNTAATEENNLTDFFAKARATGKQTFAARNEEADQAAAARLEELKQEKQKRKRRKETGRHSNRGE